MQQLRPSQSEIEKLTGEPRGLEPQSADGGDFSGCLLFRECRRRARKCLLQSELQISVEPGGLYLERVR